MSVTDTPMTVSVTLDHSPKTDSILLGYRIGSAALPHDRELQIDAAGRKLRFSVTGVDGYVDVDISELAALAAILLTGEGA